MEDFEYKKPIPKVLEIIPKFEVLYSVYFEQLISTKLKTLLNKIKFQPTIFYAGVVTMLTLTD